MIKHLEYLPYREECLRVKFCVGGNLGSNPGGGGSLGGGGGLRG